jgi:GntR family transcriptional regulator, trigonelline degradation regulator
MGAVFEQLTNTTLRGRIAEKLRDAILNGSLKEGERLVERKLAAQFATSLTAVREALIELESEGFVVKRPNAATYVARLTLEAADHIFAVRRLLEVHAMEEAARQATPDHIRNLERIYLDLLDAARHSDTRRFIETDYLLHESIWRISGNDYLVAALRRVVLPVFATSSIRVAASRPFDLLEDAQLHVPLLDAIRAKDPDRARAALLAAIEEWLKELRAILTDPARHEN